MSWNDFHARQAVLEEVLTRARVDPDSALPFDEIPGAVRHFGSRDNLLLALQHRWSNHLAAKLDQAGADGTPFEGAWRQLAAEQPTLRALLDAGAATSQPLRHEQRYERRIVDSYVTGRPAREGIGHPAIVAAKAAGARS
ncbi:hypothetical protein [Rhodococcus sp. NPDC058514]|uniref:hypothetical protein n=1 Tax=unclassified Rhodococcus (in: high G+C Gram-positive bacteria) TaxID=192944 RepID=UPI003649BBF4